MGEETKEIKEENMVGHIINVGNSYLSEKHICWFVENVNAEDEVRLVEVVERAYDHPDVPGHATIPRIETVLRRIFKKTDRRAAAALMLYYAQVSVSEIEKLSVAHLK